MNNETRKELRARERAEYLDKVKTSKQGKINELLAKQVRTVEEQTSLEELQRG